MILDHRQRTLRKFGDDPVDVMTRRLRFRARVCAIADHRLVARNALDVRSQQVAGDLNDLGILFIDQDFGRCAVGEDWNGIRGG